MIPTCPLYGTRIVLTPPPRCPLRYVNPLLAVQEMTDRAWQALLTQGDCGPLEIARTCSDCIPGMLRCRWVRAMRQDARRNRSTGGRV
jgi:hypothetical protein